MIQKTLYLLLVGFLLTGATCSENTSSDNENTTIQDAPNSNIEKSFKDLPEDDYTPPPAEEEEDTPDSSDGDSEEG